MLGSTVRAHLITHTRAEGPNPMLESVGEEITQQHLHAHQRGATYSVRIDQG